ncbi:MAG: hypothetical protein KAI79_14000 [Bacteroidales bacterium]|nr:hypothetical protein [Bacteroidales bacterium]
MEEFDKLQYFLKTGWFTPEKHITRNRHLRISERLTITPEMAKELNDEIEHIIINSSLGIEPTKLQKIAFQLLKNSY